MLSIALYISKLKIFSSVTDVTAIWNANAFFAYVFSIKLLNLKWGFIRMCAVCISSAGVLIILYAGSTPSNQSISVRRDMVASRTATPFIGDILTLVASVLYGLYQVLYKKYVALPSDPELAIESVHYTHIPASAEQVIDEETISLPLPASNEITHSLPFGLHPNFLTTCIGLCTLFVLWIPLPILHYYGIEEFELPSNMVTLASIAGICATGVIFNAGFMVRIMKMLMLCLLTNQTLLDLVGSLGPDHHFCRESAYHRPYAHLGFDVRFRRVDRRWIDGGEHDHRSFHAACL